MHLLDDRAAAAAAAAVTTDAAAAAVAAATDAATDAATELAAVAAVTIAAAAEPAAVATARLLVDGRSNGRMGDARPLVLRDRRVDLRLRLVLHVPPRQPEEPALRRRRFGYADGAGRQVRQHEGRVLLLLAADAAAAVVAAHQLQRPSVVANRRTLVGLRRRRVGKRRLVGGVLQWELRRRADDT